MRARAGMDKCGMGSLPQDDRYGTCFAIPPEGKRNSKNQTTDEAMEACRQRRHTLPGMRRLMAYSFKGDRYYTRAAWCSGMNVVLWSRTRTCSSRMSRTSRGATARATRSASPTSRRVHRYPLREVSRVFVDFPWTVVPDDPSDEIFYSTCLHRLGKALTGRRVRLSSACHRQRRSYKFGEVHHVREGGDGGERDHPGLEFSDVARSARGLSRGHAVRSALAAAAAEVPDPPAPPPQPPQEPPHHAPPPVPPRPRPFLPTLRSRRVRLCRYRRRLPRTRPSSASTAP